jgi:hypothetical protein
MFFSSLFILISLAKATNISRDILSLVISNFSYPPNPCWHLFCSPIYADSDPQLFKIVYFYVKK